RLRRHRGPHQGEKAPPDHPRAPSECRAHLKDDKDQIVKARAAREPLKSKHKARPTFDPNDLPNKSLQPNPANKPKLNRKDFVRAGLTDNPTVKLAAVGDFKFDKLAGASDPA